MNTLFSKQSTTRITLIISIALFIFSLTQSCFNTENGPGEAGEGLAILFSGSFGFFLCPAGFTWLANPALLISWLYINRNPRKSLIASVVATVLSFSFLLFTNIIVNEGGNTAKITTYRIGYWLWLTSALIMLVFNLYRRFFEDKKPVSSDL
ncbi:MAG: hypothetical protein ACXVJB_04725 [Mucilaginibacter sp.]